MPQAYDKGRELSICLKTELADTLWEKSGPRLRVPGLCKQPISFFTLSFHAPRKEL